MKPPAIRSLTESLTDLSPTEWRTILSKLRRARLLAGEDPHNPGELDTHPLVREYFGEQLRSQQTDAWEECNQAALPLLPNTCARLPNSFREMEPLFLAVIWAAMPVCFATRYMKFTLRGSIGAIPLLLVRFSGPGWPCSRL